MTYIATRTFTLHAGRKPIKIVKGEPITDAQYAKLNQRQRQDYTELMRSQTFRRIELRRQALKVLGIESDVNLIVMEAICDAVPDEVIKGWGRCQPSKIRSIEKPIIEAFGGIEPRVIEGLVDDPKQGTEARQWRAWPLTLEQEPQARQMARDIIAEKWGY